MSLTYNQPYGGGVPQGWNPWIQLATAVVNTAGDIFGQGGNQQPPQPSTPPIAPPPANQGFGFPDLFGGGDTVEIFGMTISKTVIIILVVYLLFFRGKGGIRL